jgi:hypothetical protein
MDKVTEFPFSMEVPLDRLVKNSENPNEMTEREFNALADSVQQEGWTQPMASVVPIGKFDSKDPYGWKQFSIVGGHHRLDVATVLGFDTGPCWVLDPAKFDDDRQAWNLVKQNILHGSLNPEKFSKLYDRLAKTYDKEVMQALMGFTGQDAFQKLYREVRNSLPDDLKAAMDDVKDEIRTIDDLSLVLNRLFAQYGETLPSNMMVFSWAGKEVLWVRCSDETWEAVSAAAAFAADTKADFDQVVRQAFEALA